MDQGLREQPRVQQPSLLVCTSNSGKLREFSAALGQSFRIQGIGDLPLSLKKRYGDPAEDGQSFVHNALIKLTSAMGVFVDDEEQLHPQDVPSAILVDDSGLVVPELGGQPGVHSALYAGLPRDDHKNRNLLARHIHERGRSVFVNGQDQRRLPGYFVASLLVFSWAEATAAQRRQMWHELGLILQCKSSALRSKDFPSLDWESSVFRHCEQNNLASISRKPLALGLVGACLTVAYGFCRGQVAETEQALLDGEGHGYDPLFFPNEHPDRSFASIPLQEKNRLSHRGRGIQALLQTL